MIKSLLKRCNELFSVESGKLIRTATQSPNAKIGEVAGWIDNTGYMKVRVDGKTLLVHRVIFLMTTGTLPTLVDHIDGDILNNKPDNLREASKSQNRWNCKPNKGSQSGVKGVYFDRGRWKALVNYKGRRYYLGMFSSVKEAATVVNEKYKELHGEFANNYVPSTKETTND